MNKIIKVFSQSNLRVLKELDPEEGRYLREISERTGISPGGVHLAIETFRGLDLIRESSLKNKRMIYLNLKNNLLKGIRSLLNVYSLKGCPGFSEMSKLGSIGIYGSFANGTDSIKSDIDAWIFSEKATDLVLAKPFIRKMESKLGKKISFISLTPERISELRRKDPEFYYRLKLTSIAFGDMFD